MSIKYNNKTIAGYYKTEIIPNADTVNAGKIRIATQAEVDSGESNSTAVTPSYLSKKQDKLTAGKNITIENGVISADTTTGINVDGETISNENAVLSSIGTKTKSNTIKIDWEGTEAEYEAGLADGTISNDWYCYITDDETVVDFADHTELEVQNMYKTGNVSTDTTGYNQLVEMKSSGNKTDIDTVKIGGETVEIPYTLSKTGSKIVDVAYRDKVQALYNQEGKADYYTIDETNQNFTLPMGEIYGMKANSDLSNLTTTGEKHFLNKSQITNCLLEIPQRIKYTLENGTLTIKAGSVVIVPYGTEDKTTDLPKGATFINENFKVYDTQFSDGKFFVWAELVNDMSKSYTVSDTDTQTRIISIAIKANGIVDSLGSVSSATPSASQYTIVYNLSTNLIGHTYENSTIYYGEYISSLPIMLTVAKGKTPFDSIKQVFNGMGYIGSTVWVDKGFKGLIPNGRNADGSLNNLEYTTSKLSLRTDTIAMTTYLQSNATGIGEVVTSNYHETETEPKSPDGWNVWYKPSENIAYLKNIGDSSSKWTPQYMQTGLAEIVRGDNGKIISFAPKLPFRAADWNDLNESKPRIGQPQLSLDNVLPSNCVWLEGATVSRTTYSKLFAIYGTTYGKGDDSTTFVLPNFLNRAVWGSNNFGYITAGLPNITGTFRPAVEKANATNATGAFSYTSNKNQNSVTSGWGNKEVANFSFNASRSSSIYGKSSTVQPPAIKVRVYARYQ